MFQIFQLFSNSILEYAVLWPMRWIQITVKDKIVKGNLNMTYQ